ncbi:hypothetical protein [Chromobacterium subtsugae]|uniref:hypothetical protein n=1 Tax=Chromobacterium subtsugae TaxID=251747 RepID=UPI0012FF6B22|nr:hypothetical protein [Chromobacterium subtsugae]
MQKALASFETKAFFASRCAAAHQIETAPLLSGNASATGALLAWALDKALPRKPSMQKCQPSGLTRHALRQPCAVRTALKQAGRNRRPCRFPGWPIAPTPMGEAKNPPRRRLFHPGSQELQIRDENVQFCRLPEQ